VLGRFAGAQAPLAEDAAGQVQLRVRDISGLDAGRIVETVEAVRAETGADAVEMESQIICAICLEQKIPSAIVRVILDTASEDLPLDFNVIMTADQRMHYGKLALALMKSPGKIGALLRLRKQARLAAENLGRVLDRITESKA